MARLVAREFRDGGASNASNADSFSLTTPLASVKMLIVLSLLHDLASLDVGDACKFHIRRLFLLRSLGGRFNKGEHGDGGRFGV